MGAFDGRYRTDSRDNLYRMADTPAGGENHGIIGARDDFYRPQVRPAVRMTGDRTTDGGEGDGFIKVGDFERLPPAQRNHIDAAIEVLAHNGHIDLTGRGGEARMEEWEDRLSKVPPNQLPAALGALNSYYNFQLRRNGGANPEHWLDRALDVVTDPRTLADLGRFRRDLVAHTGILSREEDKVFEDHVRGREGSRMRNI
jgi:hypothetical protein